MSPIYHRSVREQLEHDRVIRTLESRWRPVYHVETNIGDELKAPVKVGPGVVFPDLVVVAPGSPRKVLAVVEVETAESVNGLEARAEWVRFSRARAPLLLYVPTVMVDVARRISQELRVTVGELWSYYTVGEQVGFTLVERARGLAECVPIEGMPLLPVAPVESKAAPVSPTTTEAATAPSRAGSKAAGKVGASHAQSAPSKGSSKAPAKSAAKAPARPAAKTPAAAEASTKAKSPARPQAKSPARVAAKGPGKAKAERAAARTPKATAPRARRETGKTASRAKAAAPKATKPKAAAGGVRPKGAAAATIRKAPSSRPGKTSAVARSSRGHTAKATGAKRPAAKAPPRTRAGASRSQKRR